jgi:hypothetical protein
LEYSVRTTRLHTTTQDSTRFGKGPVIILEDFPAVAIPTTVYECFEDYRIDQLPPNSRSLSPFSSIWKMVERFINNQPERDRPKNIDDVWESIYLIWGIKAKIQNIGVN